MKAGYSVVALVILAPHTTACTTWQRVPTEAGLSMIEERQATKVRLGTWSGNEFEVIRPMARNDTIVFSNGTRRLSYRQISRVSVAETDRARTAAAVVVGVGIVAYLVQQLLPDQQDADWRPTPCVIWC